MQRNYINNDEKTKSVSELNQIGPYIWRKSYEEYSKYSWKKNRKIQFTCERCHKPCVMVRQYIHKFICKSCMCKDREANKDQVSIHEKAKLTMQQRYGVDNPSQIPDHNKKVAATCQKRYGVDHYSQSEEGRKRSSDMRKQWKREGRYKEIMNKAQETLRERYGYDMSDPTVIQRLRDGSLNKYGTEFPMQSEACKQQVIATVRERYGVDSVNQLESKKEAARQTCIEKYGAPYYAETADFLEDWRSTLHDRYGVYNPMYHPKFFKKMQNTMMQRYDVDNPAYIDHRSPYLIQAHPVIKDVEFIEKVDNTFISRCNECNNIIKSFYMNPSCPNCHPCNNTQYVDECIHMIRQFYAGNIIKGPHPKFPADIWIPEYKTAIIINMTYHIATGDRNNGIIISNDQVKQQGDQFYRWNPDGMVFIITEVEFKQFKHRIINSIKTYITKRQTLVDPYVTELDKKDANKFLSQYYDPDPRYFTYALGLFESSELIAVATFNVANHKCHVTCLQVKEGWALDVSLLFDEMTSSYGATQIFYEVDYRISNADLIFDKLSYDGLKEPMPVYYYKDQIHYLHVTHMESETRTLLDRAYDGSLTPYENLEKQCYMFLDMGRIMFSIRRFVR